MAGGILAFAGGRRMGVIDAFTSTWSRARSTFGSGVPSDGSRYDQSGTLRRIQSTVSDAAPGSRWTGSAANAYDAVNTEHGRVLGALASLDERLMDRIGQSARVVSKGRGDLDAVRKWVFDVAGSLPRNAAGERMLLSTVRTGIGRIAEIVERSNQELNAVGADIRSLDAQYRALGDQKFREPAPNGKGAWEPEGEYEKALREAGLLNQEPTGYYQEWLDNAKERGVPPEEIVEIAQQQNITPRSFEVLDGMERVEDRDGKDFFLLPAGTSGADARKAALMTYVLDCGTDYGKNRHTDFRETPYSAAEVQRIADRQEANAWSYDQDVAFVQDNGGHLMTTPNGMLMGMGGNQLQDMFSEGGGSTWGDIFMVNIDDPTDPAQTLRRMVESGDMWYPTAGGEGAPGQNNLDLDRILHHEERHSQQWQRLGYGGFIADYALGKVMETWGDHPLEKDAGLSDGGYR